VEVVVLFHDLAKHPDKQEPLEKGVLGGKARDLVLELALTTDKLASSATVELKHQAVSPAAARSGLERGTGGHTN
jgi:hypothetical protein